MILLVMGFRLICYSLLTNPWLTLPIELLNGLTLGVYWSTVIKPVIFLYKNESSIFSLSQKMTSYAYLIAPPGAGTTLQGIFGALFEGIGNVYMNFKSNSSMSFLCTFWKQELQSEVFWVVSFSKTMGVLLCTAHLEFTH